MLRKIVPVVLIRLVMAAIGAAVAYSVCSVSLRSPAVAGNPVAEAVTVACGFVTVVVAVVAPLEDGYHD